MRFNFKAMPDTIRNIPCAGIGIEGYNAAYSFVWHWDVFPTKDGAEFGNCYSISEYLTGSNLVHGCPTLDKAIQQVQVLMKNTVLHEFLKEWPKINDPQDYFFN